MIVTDNEVIKALEEWRKEIIADYQRLQLLGAPMDCFEESHADTVTKLSDALDLINRQKAEIERLQDGVRAEHSVIPDLIKKVRGKAIKEFAESAEKKLLIVKDEYKNFIEKGVVDECIYVIKEMVGDSNV